MVRTINISLPEELVKKIDELSKAEYASRSDFIRETLVRRIKGQRIVEEWGDSGEWEPVVDFREVSPRGATASDVLKAARKLSAK